MIDISRHYVKPIDWNVGLLSSIHNDYIVLMKKFQELDIDPNIRYVYGNINCLWNSGRSMRDLPSISTFMDQIEFFNKMGIGCRLTFSNHYIKSFDDKICNSLLDFLNKANKANPNIKNGVMVVLDDLNKYIRSTYPNIEIVASLYKPMIEVGFINDTVDYYNKLFDLYDVVVLNTSKVKNRDMDFLHNIAYPERSEMIANNYCMPNCPIATRHANLVAENQRFAYIDNEQDYIEHSKPLADIHRECEAIKDKIGALNSVLLLTENEMNELIEMGYTHFKMQGREWMITSMLSSLGHYVYNHEQFASICYIVYHSLCI